MKTPTTFSEKVDEMVEMKSENFRKAVTFPPSPAIQ